MARSICCLFTLLVMAQAAASAPVEAGFCTRLAPGLGLSPKKDSVGGYWQTNTLNPMQRLVIGGTTMMGFQAKPVAQVSGAQLRRLDEMCGMEKKSLACNIVGPVRIKAQAGGKEAEVEATQSERARLWTSGTRVSCRDLPASLP